MGFVQKWHKAVKVVRIHNCLDMKCTIPQNPCSHKRKRLRQSYGKNLAACISAKKGQLFVHSSPFFSPDALHRTQKTARLAKNCLLF
jgi:hypothetical protein